MKRFNFNSRSFAKAKLQATSLWLVAAIIAMAFTACTKKSETQTETTAVQSQTGSKHLVSVPTFTGSAARNASFGQPEKLAERIAAPYSSSSYEYDDQNRIVKKHEYGKMDVTTTTITYNGNDIVKTVTVYKDDYSGEESIVDTKNFTRNGNKIYTGSETITLNNDGYIIICEWEDNTYRHYSYHDGNVIKITDTTGDYREDFYEYDNKVSPFYHCNTPKWYLVWSGISYGLVNNIIRDNYKYEYDADGYIVWGDLSDDWGIRYEYRQGGVWEPAELTGEWHSRSITDGCHGQEHYIFTADGYYRKGDLYQKHDGTWSLVIDAATGKYHLTLQYKQFIDFESGWTPNDFTAYAEYETIDPNNIDLLLPGAGWIELTRCNNPGWNAQ